MLSTAVVIFREVLEISLVVTTLLAATCRVTKRSKWIMIGLGAGIAGSLVIAVFAEKIAMLAEGMGQELFNASVLFAAAILIGWTVVWMRRHGREIAQHVKEIGQDVLSGKKPLYTLAIIVALSVLREGSEIVLFAYGIMASGEPIGSMLIGSLIGLAGGLAIGFGLYFGLIRISPRYLFSVTSWLLIFVAAGMVSESIGWLQASGVITILSNHVWDSTYLLADQSLIGRIMHTLIGYTARPTAIQLLGYLATIGLIALLMRLYGGGSKPKQTLSMVTALVVLLFTMPQDASAAQKVYSPIVESGELEIEIKGSHDFDDSDEKSGASKLKQAIGYGLTEWWFIEVEHELEHEPHASGFEATAVELENIFQLTEQGEYFIDAGLFLEYELALEEKHADKIETKLLLEKSFTDFTHTANIILEKKVGSHTEEQLEGGFAWSSKYRINKSFEPGFEYYAEFGEFTEHKDFEEQEHMVGPVVYGQLGHHVKYDVGYLFGISDEAPEGRLKWILEYELRF